MSRFSPLLSIFKNKSKKRRNMPIKVSCRNYPVLGSVWGWVVTPILSSDLQCGTVNCQGMEMLTRAHMVCRPCTDSLTEINFVSLKERSKSAIWLLDSKTTISCKLTQEKVNNLHYPSFFLSIMSWLTDCCWSL